MLLHVVYPRDRTVARVQNERKERFEYILRLICMLWNRKCPRVKKVCVHTSVKKIAVIVGEYQDLSLKHSSDKMR